MKVIYKTVTNAFSDLDYTGKGRVLEEDFFRTLVIYKLPFSKEVSLSLTTGNQGIFHPGKCLQRIRQRIPRIE